MKSLPEALQNFLDQATVVGEALLPVHYPAPDGFDALQIGYRTHGLTGQSLVGDADGDWQPSWFVIAMTGLDDPIFISTAKAHSGYPVYYAPHGAGRWDAMQIAPSLAAFGRLLATLAEVNDDDAAFARVVLDETDASNAFWREILDARRNAEAPQAPSVETGNFDPTDHQQSDLLVIDLGPQKLKVIQLVSKSRGLPLKEALALAEALPLKAASGVKPGLRRLSEQLEQSGARVEFRRV
ncbi:SMI1/KNR4 family protein [Pseudomonas sp. DTU_2021_1001937_2_SI_NGA_ILE_001]|uniref:SMI1/KNR4 family protein n=1 Tax=Pseudomonas sp. DTU_2021_1001937_2_SI_NGA_ILE_001 TaxID=3077589 RepID=UPI0028FC1452|nr:SMI1/KNR4 family protein [Pseudomonas sp. DTU_2021_1001937_2_SI_NGA_ILE_001]WNW10023.1 SMI1/KNR4 family protein [Pseudomonas sp. DTU_2021_1001937_2_SI_NGA_ILE_001]